MVNQCVVCGSEMPEGNHVCRSCRNDVRVRKIKVYIAGKITGLGIKEYSKKFNDAQKILEKQGHTVFNPIKMVKQDAEYEDQIAQCFRIVVASDVVYMLDNWKQSSGARREHAYAFALNKKIVYQEIND